MSIFKSSKALMISSRENGKHTQVRMIDTKVAARVDQPIITARPETIIAITKKVNKIIAIVSVKFLIVPMI